jgi:hypothetical protein
MLVEREVLEAVVEDENGVWICFRGELGGKDAAPAYDDGESWSEVTKLRRFVSPLGGVERAFGGHLGSFRGGTAVAAATHDGLETEFEEAIRDKQSHRSLPRTACGEVTNADHSGVGL